MNINMSIVLLLKGYLSKELDVIYHFSEEWLVTDASYGNILSSRTIAGMPGEAFPRRRKKARAFAKEIDKRKRNTTSGRY